MRASRKLSSFLCKVKRTEGKLNPLYVNREHRHKVLKLLALSPASNVILEDTLQHCELQFSSVKWR